MYVNAYNYYVRKLDLQSSYDCLFLKHYNIVQCIADRELITTLTV